MQGRITKVLNMRPPEILAMIEEAAGTLMFKGKKEKALKGIVKKRTKNWRGYESNYNFDFFCKPILITSQFTYIYAYVFLVAT